VKERETSRALLDPAVEKRCVVFDGSGSTHEYATMAAAGAACSHCISSSLHWSSLARARSLRHVFYRRN
jgi:hypothetical protein